jgi:ATP-dependent DNA helicase PIF1
MVDVIDLADSDNDPSPVKPRATNKRKNRSSNQSPSKAKTLHSFFTKRLQPSKQDNPEKPPTNPINSEPLQHVSATAPVEASKGRSYDGDYGDQQDEEQEIELALELEQDCEQEMPPDDDDAMQEPLHAVSTRPTQCPSVETKVNEEEINLDPSQHAAFERVMSGENVFLTGPAGSGKSMLLKKIIKALEKGSSRVVAVLAPTGIAAVNVGGTTVHSWSGCGLPKMTKDFAKMWNKSEEIRSTDVIVLDEISMMSGEMFDRMEEKVAEIRGNTQPFGGIQLVLSGDFLQLPPVTNKPDAWMLQSRQVRADSVFLNRGFCFQAECWERCSIRTCELNVVHRQGADTGLIDALREIRLGRLSNSAERLIEECSVDSTGGFAPDDSANGVKPTKLYCKNADVEDINEKELRMLPGHAEVIKAKDEVEVEADQDGHSINGNYTEIKKQLENDAFFHSKKCRAPAELTLKDDAQVLLLWNLDLAASGDMKLVNGSRGKVVGWEPWKEVFRRLKEDRARQKANAKANGDNGGSSKVEAKIDAIHAVKVPDRGFPVVEFDNGRTETVLPEAFTHSYRHKGVCTRTQLPLRLAWAITIHKSQGMSISRLCVSLADVFEDGQAYVALSRARSKHGLQIEGYTPGVIHANPTALQFLESSSRGQRGEAVSWKVGANTLWSALKEEAAHLAATAPKCPGHGKPCSRFQVKKAGNNQGKSFFKCAQQPQCDFFAWDDGDTSASSSSSSSSKSIGSGGGYGASAASSYSGGGASNNGRPGDWECDCGANVFAYKTECFKCGAAKPNGNRGGSGGRKSGGSSYNSYGGSGASNNGRAGDWTCGSCSANVFAFKTECFKCGAAKPSGAGGGKDTKHKGGRGWGGGRGSF